MSFLFLCFLNKITGELKPYLPSNLSFFQARLCNSCKLDTEIFSNVQLIINCSIIYCFKKLVYSCTCHCRYSNTLSIYKQFPFFIQLPVNYYRILPTSNSLISLNSTYKSSLSVLLPSNFQLKKIPR
jgi:hypothetical protein